MTLPELPQHTSLHSGSDAPELYIGDESGGFATPTATSTKSVKSRDATPQELEAATMKNQAHVPAYLLRKHVCNQKENTFDDQSKNGVFDHGTIQRFAEQCAKLLSVVSVTEHVLEMMFEARSEDAVPCARLHEAFGRHKDAVSKEEAFTETSPQLVTGQL